MQKIRWKKNVTLIQRIMKKNRQKIKKWKRCRKRCRKKCEKTFAYTEDYEKQREKSKIEKEGKCEKNVKLVKMLDLWKFERHVLKNSNAWLAKKKTQMPKQRSKKNITSA